MPPAVHVSPSADTNADAAKNTKGRHKLAQVSRRPTVRDFEYLARDPPGNVDMLAQYVGTDSKYSLAGRHAAQMVRESARSSDLSHSLQEATNSLTLIAALVDFIHSLESLKIEQRGCLALRVCFSSLTALMGDFSSGDISTNDPNVPIVTRAALGTFWQHYPPVTQVILKLAEKLAKSINVYRHRRSPSANVVTKFQGMLRTLEAWNTALRDSTFQEPTEIIQTWLSNHSIQVDAIQMRAHSVQSPPVISETIPSPVAAAYDSALLPPYSYTSIEPRQYTQLRFPGEHSKP